MGGVAEVLRGEWRGGKTLGSGFRRSSAAEYACPVQPSGPEQSSHSSCGVSGVAPLIPREPASSPLSDEGTAPPLRDACMSLVATSAVAPQLQLWRRDLWGFSGGGGVWMQGAVSGRGDAAVPPQLQNPEQQLRRFCS